MLKQSGVRTLISATAFKTSDYVRMVEEVRPDTDALKDVVYLGTDDWSRLRSRAELVPDDDLRSRMAALTNTEPINIQHTSGTTGFPKGATLSHRNILNNGFFVTELIKLGPRDRLCIPVPFYHCFGVSVHLRLCADSRPVSAHGPAPRLPAAGEALPACLSNVGRPLGRSAVAGRWDTKFGHWGVGGPLLDTRESRSAQRWRPFRGWVG